MSNAFLSSQGSIGPIPPTVATVYHTDNGNAIPAANILNVYGDYTETNNDNGVRTTGSGDTVTVELTNRIVGTTITDDNAPKVCLTVPLGADPGTYYISGTIVAYDVTDALSIAFPLEGVVRTDGAAGYVVAGSGIINQFQEIDGLQSTVDTNALVGVVDNNGVVIVIGLPGKTINWKTIVTYIFQGI